MPRISIVIITYNRKTDLQNILENLISIVQDWTSTQIIVVDASQPYIFKANSQLIASYDINITHVSSEKNKSNQLNKGILLSKGEYILFLDDDVILNDDYLVKIVQCFDNDCVVGATGFVVNQKNYHLIETLFRKFFLLQDVNKRVTIRKSSGYFSFLNNPKGVCTTNALWGCNMMIKKNILHICTFDEQLQYYSDLDISLCLSRIGSLRISEYAKLIHYRSGYGRESVWRVLIKQALSNYKIIRKHRDGHIVYFAFLWSMIGTLILVCLSFILSIDLTKGTLAKFQDNKFKGRCIL